MILKQKIIIQNVSNTTIDLKKMDMTPEQSNQAQQMLIQ